MEKLNIAVDLKTALSKEEVFKLFSLSLNLQPAPKHSWDAFEDEIRNLDTDSSVVISKKPQSIHLILKNTQDFRRNLPEEYCTLLDILAKASSKKQGGKITFTFEIAND